MQSTIVVEEHIVTNEVVVVAAAGLFLTWTATVVGVVTWLNKKFGELHEAIHTKLSVDDYRREMFVERRRTSALEWWALRLGSSVRVDFATMSEPDNRAHDA